MRSSGDEGRSQESQVYGRTMASAITTKAATWKCPFVHRNALYYVHLVTHLNYPAEETPGGCGRGPLSPTTQPTRLPVSKAVWGVVTSPAQSPMSHSNPLQQKSRVVSPALPEALSLNKVVPVCCHYVVGYFTMQQ